MKLPAFTVILCLAATACLAYRKNALVFKDLYSFVEDKAPPTESIERLPAGVRSFLNEGKEFAENQPKDSTPFPNQEYDFIVVGGGTAGATVAARLSEIEDATVLVIEGGIRESIFLDVPILSNFIRSQDEINWKFQTESSKSYCLGMTEQRCNWPMGRVMGGSSVLNNMIASRGNPQDYDEWSDMGNQGWSYDDLLPYFKKLEDMGIEELKGNTKTHNVGGPVHIEYPPYHTPLAESFIEAGLELGYPVIDYNSNQKIGFSYVQSTQKNGTRWSANRAYMPPASDRKNLFVTRLSHVDKVLIDPATKTAYGVEFTKMGMKIHVRARKEVILCAGVIKSAQILMLSGVGPAQHLKEMNIDLIQDAPVGENLMDHIAYGGLVFLVDQPVGIAKDVTNPINPYLYDYFNRRWGPYTVPGGFEALTFVDVDGGDDHPNVELLFSASSIVSDLTARNNTGISEEYWTKMFDKIQGRNSWTVYPILTKPRSRGRILLRNKDPRSKPKIIANYLNDTEDVRVMIRGIKAAIEVSKTKSMQRFDSTFYERGVPGCEDYEYDSDKYWECALRTFTLTIYDHCGTCKMAPVNDPTGVVNPRLKVKGIKGLRVADASIMPVITTSHTSIPVVMIGEKLADMVKEEWGYVRNTNYV